MSLAPQGRWLSVPPLVQLEGQGSGSLGGGGVALGVSISFSPLPLSPDPIPFISCSLCSIKGKALLGEVRSLIDKRAVELAPPSHGYYSLMFAVWKTSGSWRPLIDLSLLNGFVLQTPFGDHPVGSRCGSVGQLDGLHRPEGCLSSSSCSSREQEVPSVCGLREGLPVQGPLFRSVHGPSSLHQGNGSSLVSPSQSGCPNSPLFGRLADSRLVPIRGFVGKGHFSICVTS